MTSVIREGDATTTGGVVLQTSGTHSWEDRRLARMGDPVWCAVCKEVGYIAQGNPTYIDQLMAVATHGQRVHCACEGHDHRLLSSQNELLADMDAAIDIPKDLAEKARKRARRLNRALCQEAPSPYMIMPAAPSEASRPLHTMITELKRSRVDGAAQRIAGSAYAGDQDE